MIENLTFKDFQSKVIEALCPVIVYFTATWDTIGIQTRNYLETVNESNLHIVKVYSVDYDTERELVEKFSVRNLPDIYAFKNGRLVGAAIHCTNDNELSLLFGGNFSC